VSLHSDIVSLVSSLDLELYDAAVVSEGDETIYRVSVISKEIVDGKRAGVSLENCVELTHLISPLLDVTPPVSGEYRLEVGSPGIERKLTTLDHFKMSVGENISFGKEKDKIRGLLQKVEGSKLFVVVDAELVEFEFNDIKKARTYFEW